MPNIIVSLSAKYKSVAKIFFEQIQKHFKCDNLDVYVVSDEDFDIDYPIKDKYINNQKSIPGRIFELVNKIGDNDYLCFLADALACADVSEDAINSIINEFREKGIEYCNLIPKEIKNHKMEEIKRTLRYGVSFIAFYATKGFILREFSGNVSDYDFEEKYLKVANESNSGTLKGMYILCENIFKLEHGIAGGKWDKGVYKKLIKDGVTIEDDVKVQSAKDIFFNRLAKFSNVFLPNKVRLFIKRIMKKMGKRFKTEL